MPMHHGSLQIGDCIKMAHLARAFGRVDYACWKRPLVPILIKCSGTTIPASNGVQFVDADRAGCAAVFASHHRSPFCHVWDHVRACAKRAGLRRHCAERLLPPFAGFAAGFRPSPVDFANAERWAA